MGKRVPHHGTVLQREGTFTDPGFIQRSFIFSTTSFRFAAFMPCVLFFPIGPGFKSISATYSHRGGGGRNKRRVMQEGRQRSKRRPVAESRKRGGGAASANRHFDAERAASARGDQAAERGEERDGAHQTDFLNVRVLHRRRY